MYCVVPSGVWSSVLLVVLVVVVGCFSGCAQELCRAIVVLPVVLCVGYIFLRNLVSPTQSSPGSRL